MVPETPDVEKILYGKAGVVAGLNNGNISVNMSSFDLMANHDIASG